MLHDALTSAYLAGVIDSDGYFTTQAKLGKMRADGTRATYYSSRVGCNQVYRKIPDLLCATFGGRVYEYPESPGRRAIFMWQCCAREAYEAADALLPFLRLKKRQAEILIELGDLLTANHRRGRGGKISAAEEAARRSLYDEIRARNTPRNREAA